MMGIKEISGNYLLILAKKLEVWGSNISCVCVLEFNETCFLSTETLVVVAMEMSPAEFLELIPDDGTASYFLPYLLTCSQRQVLAWSVHTHTHTEYWENISEESSELCFLASHCGWLNLQYLNYLFDIKQSCIISTVQLNSKALEYYGGHISYLMWLNKYRNRPAGGVLCEINGLVRCV